MNIIPDLIDRTLAEIDRELSAMLDPLDIPQSWTPRELNQYEGRRSLLNARRHEIHSHWPDYLANATAIASLTAWRDHLLSWRQRLQDELAVLPVPRTPIELGRKQNLELSIKTIERGQDQRDLETLRLAVLMQESGFVVIPSTEPGRGGRLPWVGSLAAVDARLADLAERQRHREHRLVHALMSDEEREQKARDDAERVRLANAAPQRKRRHDGTLYDRYPDGRCVDVVEAETDDAVSEPQNEPAPA